jgi:regulator of replication initiation timing
MSFELLAHIIYFLWSLRNLNCGFLINVYSSDDASRHSDYREEYDQDQEQDRSSQDGDRERYTSEDSQRQYQRRTYKQYNNNGRGRYNYNYNNRRYNNTGHYNNNGYYNNGQQQRRLSEDDLLNQARKRRRPEEMTASEYYEQKKQRHVHYGDVYDNNANYRQRQQYDSRERIPPTIVPPSSQSHANTKDSNYTSSSRSADGNKEESGDMKKLVKEAVESALDEVARIKEENKRLMDENRSYQEENYKLQRQLEDLSRRCRRTEDYNSQIKAKLTLAMDALKDVYQNMN